MSKIVVQAHQEREEEIRHQKRQLIFGKVRKVFVFLLIATLGVFAFNYRDKLQTIISSNKTVATQPDGKIKASIQGAQQAADKRDSIINEITK